MCVCVVFAFHVNVMKEPAFVLQFQIESIIIHTSKFVTNYFKQNSSKNNNLRLCVFFSGGGDGGGGGGDSLIRYFS